MIATIEKSVSSVKPKTYDGRTFLKVKLKNLAAESKIIRKEEKRATHSGLRSSLREHRRGVVRNEARHTQLAYGFLRGLAYKEIEPSAKSSPDWAKVEAMVKKYGTVHWSDLPWQQWAKINADTFARFQAWKCS